MAAGAWKLFNNAKKKIANGTIKLGVGGTGMRIGLLQTAISDVAVSLWGSLNSTEVVSGNGYSTSGKTLTNELWTGADGAEDVTYKFDVSDKTFVASGGDIVSIKTAVIFLSGAAAGSCHVVCYSTLTSTGYITIANGNSMTIQMASTGVFEMY